MRRYLAIAAALALLAGVACTSNMNATPSDADEEKKPATGDEKKPAAAADDEKWGTVKGQIIWAGGAIPEPKTIDAVNDNKDKMHCLSKGALLTEDWVINKKNKGIRWVVVSLAPDDKEGKLPVHPKLEKIQEMEVSIDQPVCRFEPRVQVMRQGQTLVAKNSSPVPHNVNYKNIKNPGDNILIPPGKQEVIKGLKASFFPLNVSCQLHLWMKCSVYIFDHPYFAVTDADGHFEIKMAPAGKCRLVVWQESMGWQGGSEGRYGHPIEIKAGGTTDLGAWKLEPPKE